MGLAAIHSLPVEGAGEGIQGTMEDRRAHSVWHKGELEIQEQAGVRDAMDQHNPYREALTAGAAAFLERQHFAVLASTDAQGRVWASPRVGPPGILTVEDARTLRIAGPAPEGDPLLENLATNRQVGMIVIDFEMRARVRINGRASAAEDGAVVLTLQQFYGNCPQYIQKRTAAEGERNPMGRGEAVLGRALTAAQQEWIARSDTFFIASAHPEYGADASHRGGRPGFVEVLSANRLAFPDYSGNNMFNTLGNLAANPNAGLAFVDFEGGRFLLLTGRARIDWDPARLATQAGALRVVDFEVDEVRELRGALPVQYTLEEYSPLNP